MNTFERIHNRIAYILIHKVGKFLLILLYLYLSVCSACVLGFVVGGLLGYFSQLYFNYFFTYIVVVPLGPGFIVGVVWGLIIFSHSSIGLFYELLTGRDNIGHDL